MTAQTREQIEAEIADLKEKNDAAPGWGAAVGARSERIKGLEQALRAMPDAGSMYELAREQPPLERSSAGSWDSKLPLRYIDGPDYCTVKDATGKDFALTVQPDFMKAMEKALSDEIASLMRAPAQPAPVTVEEIAKLVDPVAHEMYDAAYAAKDWPDQMTWIKRLEASREKAGNILFRLNPPPAATVEERQVSCAPGGQPYAKAHECSSAATEGDVHSYLDRSAVRAILIEQDDDDREIMEAVLQDIDALPVITPIEPQGALTPFDVGYIDGIILAGLLDEWENGAYDQDTKASAEGLSRSLAERIASFATGKRP